MGARYDSYDKKMNQLESELRGIRYAIELIDKHSILPPGKHVATVILVAARAKLELKITKLKAKNEV